ncbi:MAG: hypothetical protein LAO09_11220 [Acidobacteriia bacterium]|nr:hypothetical protein [Terriglobia bacterium]
MQTKHCFRILAALLATLFLISHASASDGKLLYRFPYGHDGAGSATALTLDESGNLYGTAGGGTYGAGIVFKLTPSGNGSWTKSVLYAFRGAEDGAMPQAGVVLDSGGDLYGTTSCGGGPLGISFACTRGAGTVFKLSPHEGEWSESVLHNFSGAPDGAYPAAGLVLDKAGNLYGTAEFGGSANSSCGSTGCGVVFEVAPSQSGTWSETVIHTFDFDYNGIEGAYPTGDLVFDNAGNLYGTTSRGPYHNDGGGIVFQLSPMIGGTWQESIIYNLPASNICCFPGPDLAFDAKGNIFGSAPTYPGNSGIVFELQPQPDGTWDGSVLYTFSDPNNGTYPSGKIVVDDVGNLYGTTVEGGGTGCYGYGCGVVFQLSSNSGVWTETVLFRLSGRRGCCPEGGLVRDPVGNLLGVASGGGSGGLGSLFELSQGQNGWAASLLHTFHSAQRGAIPQGALVADASGNLFGTTQSGGAHAMGSVFEIDSNGKQSVLYSFAGGKDGQSPYSKLVFDTAGNLYGTTLYGGDTNCETSGCGTVFEISPGPGGTWTGKIIHAFNGTDGSHPIGGLVFDSDGNLYGATSQGGPDDAEGGVIFQLTPTQDGSWKETTIYFFYGGVCNGPESPNGDMAFDQAGNLYGTTRDGSAIPRTCGAGTVFRLSPPQHGGYWTAAYLYSFCSIDSCSDGAYPQAGLILDTAKNIYGTTSSGGDVTCRPVSGCGVVFKLDVGAHETVLYTFKGGNDGAIPSSGLTLDPLGNLYGTTSIGGGKGVCNGFPGDFCGTIFQLVPGDNGSWTENILHRFSGPDGGNPQSGVLPDLSGHRLFGTTPYGGIGWANSVGLGVVYELDR